MVPWRTLLPLDCARCLPRSQTCHPPRARSSTSPHLHSLQIAILTLTRRRQALLVKTSGACSHARDPGDTPRKDARRNSIDWSEVEDSPRIDRVIRECSRNKGKRMSFSDEDIIKLLLSSSLIPISNAPCSPERNTPIAASHADNMEGLRFGCPCIPIGRVTDNVALIREMHGRTAPAPGISRASLQTPIPELVKW
ncbi:hypothetical protein EDB84DRAFT_1537087 [Lactarius hengduanensis]|nr:hypothetical protein EDB84DRAFT_1537087 [Lactarius hengduanensis]